MRQASQRSLLRSHRGAEEDFQGSTKHGQRLSLPARSSSGLFVPLSQSLANLRPYQVKEEHQVQQTLHKRRALVLA